MSLNHSVTVMTFLIDKGPCELKMSLTICVLNFKYAYKLPPNLKSKMNPLHIAIFVISIVLYFSSTHSLNITSC